MFQIIFDKSSKLCPKILKIKIMTLIDRFSKTFTLVIKMTCKMFLFCTGMQALHLCKVILQSFAISSLTEDVFCKCTFDGRVDL